MFDPNNADGTYLDDDVPSDPTVPATHYISSFLGTNSWNTRGNTMMVYWAEQYGATSTYGEANSWNKTPKSGGSAIVSVRCIRNLGMPYKSTANPASYYKVNDANTSISLDYMNINALRQVDDEGGALPYVNLGAVGFNNSPYFGFDVDSGYYGNNGKTTNTVTSENANYTTWYRAYQGESAKFPDVSSLCPKGWRVPNQREMKLMIRALPNDSWNFRIAPGYYYTYGYLMYNGQDCDGDYFGAFYYFPTTGQVNRRVATSEGLAAASTGQRAVRCVKDNPNAKHSSSSDYEDGGEGW